jgi:hypothetical protein
VPYDARVIQVVIASPRDVAEERAVVTPSMELILLRNQTKGHN